MAQQKVQDMTVFGFVAAGDEEQAAVVAELPEGQGDEKEAAQRFPDKCAPPHPPADVLVFPNLP